MPSPEYKTTHPKNRQQWRQWLQKNHLSSPGVWLIYFKQESGKPRVSISDAVEEALCFGWIDSISRKLDETRTMLKFTPRKPKSVWSRINKTRIEKLIGQNLVSPAGIEKIDLAKKNGSWDTLTASDAHTENNTMPADLEKALLKSVTALNNFTGFSPSNRKRFLSWIDSAKRQETRTARIRHTVLMAAANKKPGLKGFQL